MNSTLYIVWIAQDKQWIRHTVDEPNSTMYKTTISPPSQDPADIDCTTDTQPQTSKVPGEPTVDPEAHAQAEEEEVVEVESHRWHRGNSTSTSKTTHKQRISDADDNYKELKGIQSTFLCRSSEDEAKEVYDTLYKTLYTQVLPKQSNFIVTVVIHQKLCGLGKVAPLKVVREQQIPKCKCVG